MTARDRTVLMVVGMLAIVGAFWFLLIGPRHKEYTAATDATAAAEVRRDAAQTSVDEAEAAKKTYPADYAQVTELGKAVPVDDEVPSLVYQLSAAADANSVDFRSIKLSAGSGGPAAAAPVAATTSTTPTDTTSTTPAPAPAAPAATSLTAATLPPGAAIGAAGFPTMPFLFTFDGSFFNMSAFLQDLDEFIEINSKELAISGRLLTIDGIGISASRNGFPAVKASVSATAFLLPPAEGLTAGATEAAPAPADGSAAAPATAATGVTR